MSEKNQQSLSSLLKKQIKEDSKKNQAKKSAQKIAQDKQNLKDSAKEMKEGGGEKEQMSEEEKLEEAKKESMGKAAHYSQVGMYKKLLIQAIVKYIALLTILVIAAIGVIKIGPAMVKMLNEVLRGMVKGAIGIK